MLFLHLTVSSSGSVKRNYVAELAAATAHLGLEISPDDSWEDALGLVNMVGRVSHERVTHIFTELTPPELDKRRSFALSTFELKHAVAYPISTMQPVLGRVSTPFAVVVLNPRRSFSISKLRAEYDATIQPFA